MTFRKRWSRYFRSPIISRAWLVLAFATAAGSGQEYGNVEIGFQAYSLRANSEAGLSASGLTIAFQESIPDFGLLTGTLEGIGGTSGYRSGDNFLNWRGAWFEGFHWNITAGDFRATSNLVPVPFDNIFYPEINARGFNVQASSAKGEFSFFLGDETLRSGPRVAFRLGVPQRVIAFSAQRKFGSRLQTGFRVMNLRSGAAQILSNPEFFPKGREFTNITNLNLEARYSVTKHLTLFGEADTALLAMRLPGEHEGGRISLFGGLTYSTEKFAIRTNFASETSSYLPLAGYLAGDRRGPFADIRYRPVRSVELFASYNSYRNNLANDPTIPKLNSKMETAGVSLQLPGGVSVSGQASYLHLNGDDLSRNLLSTFVVSRRFGRHAIQFTARDLRLRSLAGPNNDTSGELQDTVLFGRYAVSGAVRLQQSHNAQEKKTIYARGMFQAQFRHISAQAQFESGTDLLGRSVFSTNAYRTAVFGVTASLGHNWTAHAELQRTQLATSLNPASLFLFQTQGIGVPAPFAALNQWISYFRIERRFRWGARGGDGDRGALGEPLAFGAIEVQVKEESSEGVWPAVGVAIQLDGFRTEITNEAGIARFLRVPEGIRRIAIERDGLPARYSDAELPEQNITVIPRQTAYASFRVHLLGSISGEVKWNEPGSPKGIWISLEPGGRMTTTDSNGVFVFDNLPEGVYQVALPESRLEGGLHLVSAATQSIAVRGGTSDSVPAFQIERRISEKPVRQIFQRTLKSANR